MIYLYDRTDDEVDEEQELLAELKKIEARKKEREKKTADLQKLITAAETQTSDQKRVEKKHHLAGSGPGVHYKKRQGGPGAPLKRDPMVSAKLYM